MKKEQIPQDDEDAMRQYLSPKDLRELQEEEIYGRRIPKVKDLKKLKRKSDNEN